MAISKLGLYNRAIRVLGETRLRSLTENRTVRHHLDEVWDGGESGDGGVKACLEMGLWNFALRSVEASYDPDVTPDFGYQRAFSKPSDWVRTAQVCTDEHFTNPLLDYRDERGYWFAEYDTLYFQYISNHADFGGDLSRWPESFIQVVADYFALQVASTHTKDKERVAMIDERLRKDRLEARSRDAMNDPVKFPAPDTWVLSRRGRRSGDRGSRNSLIG